MTEDIIPGVAEQTPDVAEAVAAAAIIETEQQQETPEVTAETAEPVETVEDAEEKVNYAEKTLAELSELFTGLKEKADQSRLFKEAEAIKSAFYKRLSKEKAENPVEEGTESPFTAIEQAFKSVYAEYRKEHAELTAKMEAERAENLKQKEAVIADLKALIEKQEDVNQTFPAFREIQNRWRAIGPVPMQNFRALNDTYQLYVEQFYDMVKINRELRDLDFRKNLEVKTQMCEEAEKLAENDNIVDAFKDLQKLHEQWKDYGPVAKQYREEIWDRFKAATAVINKKYQAHFEELKGRQEENLAAKTLLCEKVEAIAEQEVASSNEWNELSRQIEDIQKEWKTIGFASKKENQKIYDRFRAACDKFFARKRDFYTGVKDGMKENLDKKIALCEQAEALKTSTDWKATAEKLVELQKQWKEIGAVSRKKSEAVWKRFRAACDEFFAERDKNAKHENDFYGNLKAKKALIAEIAAYELSEDEDANVEAMKAFQARWQDIGFVPFKEKEAVTKAYRDAIAEKFPRSGQRNGRGGAGRQNNAQRAPKSLKEKLIAKYNALEQDIVTIENNIGFFAKSKSSAPLIQQMQDKIAAAKEELASLRQQIRAEEAQEQSDKE
ncbi:MAG: DUF349 domain-containing protein [Bacteroidales bacterium]|nr:DUF349 domain-containing protein [Bacteroidales bacterium]